MVTVSVELLDLLAQSFDFRDQAQCRNDLEKRGVGAAGLSQLVEIGGDRFLPSVVGAMEQPPVLVLEIELLRFIGAPQEQQRMRPVCLDPEKVGSQGKPALGSCERLNVIACKE